MKQTFTTDELIKHAKSLIGETELYYRHNGVRLSFTPENIRIVFNTEDSSHAVEKYNETHDFCVAVEGENRHIVPADLIYKKRKPLECYVYVGGKGEMEDKLMTVNKPKNDLYRLFREVIED